MSKRMISVIVPIYNVEKYLDECIKSILRQTYTDFELILVDDGSTDNSGQKADVWADKDGRITVIHKENGGLSGARNSGIKVSSGEYLFFVDSDDYIADNCLEVLLERAVQEDADIATCKFNNLWVDACRAETRMPNIDTVIEVKDYLERIYLYGVYTIVWNKLYKRKLFEGLLFEEGRLNEDAIIVPRLIERANKVAHSSEALYYYRRRKSGIMHGKKREEMLISVVQWAKEEAERHLNNGDEYFSKLAAKQCANKILEQYMFLEGKLCKEMKNELKAISRELIHYKGFGSAPGLKLLIASCIPCIYSRWYNRRLAKMTEYELFD